MAAFMGETASKMVGGSYIAQGSQNISSLNAQISELVEKRKLPAKKFSDQQIEFALNHLSLMDSNNFSGNAGVGEREGRCLSSMVHRRNFGFCHGIGRSGDITEVQPKAAGSSLLVKICKDMSLDAIRIAGVKGCSDCVLLPVATGMALSLCMMTLRESRPKARFVIFLRIDQKSCIKSILTAGFEPIVINGKLEGDELRTDLVALRSQMERSDSESILCVMSTTSCFAPRVPDNLPEIGKLCSEFNIPHVVNNAYGLQSTKCAHLLSQTYRLKYRLDAFVQSTDKNFLVPVGGSIVVSFDSFLTSKLAKMYPGRASMSPILDLFITLLSVGAEGFQKLLLQRRNLFAQLQNELRSVSELYGERLLETPHNDISMAISLNCYRSSTSENVTKLGSMLFTRFVSGARVVSCSNTKQIGRTEFKGFGSHCDDYQCDYLTAAAGLGIEEEDIHLFVKRLKSVLSKKENIS